MSRIHAVDLENAEPRPRETLAAVQAMLGATPNLFRVAARAPSVLEALAGHFGATARGTLRPAAREAIALAVAELNGCDYCLSAHTALGRGAGLSESDIDAARDAASTDARTAAMLRFAREIVVSRGARGGEALEELRRAGVRDDEALEVVSTVVLNIFTNYVNLVADTDIDFPVVRSKAR